MPISSPFPDSRSPLANHNSRPMPDQSSISTSSLPKVAAPSTQDILTSKWNISIVYLTAVDMGKKVGKIKNRLASVQLKMLNVSIVESNCIEVLVDGVDTREWKEKARSVGFKVLDGFDPVNADGLSVEKFVRRAKNEVRTARQARAKEFYREWRRFCEEPVSDEKSIL